LNAAQKTAARRAFALFLENPGHNSLQFKKLRGYPDYWSVRVSRDFRAVGKQTGDTIEWAWIGTHKRVRQTLRMNTALLRNPHSAFRNASPSLIASSKMSILRARVIYFEL